MNNILSVFLQYILFIIHIMGPALLNKFKDDMHTRLSSNFHYTNI